MARKKQYVKVIWKNLSAEQLERVEVLARESGRCYHDVVVEVVTGQKKLK